jgi:hypothetical protein
MRNIERIKKEIAEIKYDLGDLEYGGGLKHIRIVFDKCFILKIQKLPLKNLKKF